MNKPMYDLCNNNNNNSDDIYISAFNLTEEIMNDSFCLDKKSIESYIYEYMRDDETELLRELSPYSVFQETNTTTNFSDYRLSMIFKIQRWIRVCYMRNTRKSSPN